MSSRQRRLITALALAGTRSRTYFANLLWPDCSESQAAGSLRASLHAISHQQPGLLNPSSNPLSLDSSVAVDVNRVRRIIADIDGQEIDRAGAIHELRGADLLPDWYEDWVLFERERLNSQRLRALESLAEHYLAIADIGRALDAAGAAVEIEPLRESSHLLLLRCHLALGNSAAAMRLYHSLEERLLEEMSIAPSPRFTELLDGVLASRHARR
ncbi:BTAD domain-containing putative transcriptional regulator [Lacisediminihabitans sp.]|uniref:AfsR/SARP family transcriptional regulator n=1 Tax=Lacisediminihabitans sp. TaxID=2787631 RepID=UPI00374D90C2